MHHGESRTLLFRSAKCALLCWHKKARKEVPSLQITIIDSNSVDSVRRYRASRGSPFGFITGVVVGIIGCAIAILNDEDEGSAPKRQIPPLRLYETPMPDDGPRRLSDTLREELSRTALSVRFLEAEGKDTTELRLHMQRLSRAAALIKA